MCFFGKLLMTWQVIVCGNYTQINEDAQVRCCKKLKAKFISALVLISLIAGVVTWLSPPVMGITSSYLIKCFLLAVALSSNLGRLPFSCNTDIMDEYPPAIVDETLYCVSQVTAGVFLTLVLAG